MRRPRTELTDEEKEMMAQLQAQSANQQPDPATIMAMAEMEKAKQVD